MNQEALRSTPVKRSRMRRKSTQASARERLIRCGVEILTEKGFAGIRLEEVLNKVKVPKGSFYHYFPSKANFGLALIDNYAAYFANKLDHWLLNEARTPVNRLRDFISDAKSGIERFDFKRGCLIGNMGQELGGTEDDFRAPLEAVFFDWELRVERCLEAARAAGEIPSTTDCQEKAAFFWIGWEGAILRTKMMRSTKPIDLFEATFLAGLSR